MKEQNMLVVARKYNDIFYAISAKEWKKCKNHYLLYIANSKDVTIPMRDSFDEIIIVRNYSDLFGYFYQCISIVNQIRKLDFSIVTISNLAMVSNLCALNPAKVKTIILLEDGIMNYSNFIPSQRLLKRLLEFAFGVNEKRIHAKIFKTYVLMPELAKYYFGSLEKLSLNTSLLSKGVSLGKLKPDMSIFVGQDLYFYLPLSVDEYSAIVNKIIAENHIDLYLPHTRADKNESIQCEKLDLSETKATLEILASLSKFKVYSFSSSVLYTIKLINPEVESISVRSNKTDLIGNDSVIYQFVDKVINM